MRPETSVSIVIRTLNERDRLVRLAMALLEQNFGNQEVVVVDNQSSDGTAEFVRNCGYKLVTVKRDEFSYPISLNRGLEAASNEIVVCLVGHALPFRTDWLLRGMQHFADPKVAGVYSPVIPHKGCTLAEILFYWPGYLAAKWKGPHRVANGGMGVFGATNIAMRKSLWLQHHFDERFGLGGEDGEWAGWAMSQGYKIICDHRFAVRHSHGLGFRQLAKQFKYWSRLGGPTTFDRSELSFRDDLNFKV